MHVTKMNIRGSGLVGLYMVATESCVIVGNEVPESLDSTIKEIFEVPIIRTTIAGTSLVGAFLCTDGVQVLVPSIIFEREERILKEAGVKFTKIKTDLTCLGNNVVATEKGTLVNPELEDFAVKQISETFCGEVKKFEIAGNPTVGSFLVNNSKFGLITPDVSNEDAKFIEKFLGIKLTAGTVEMGSPQVRSGLSVSDKGFIIGEHSGGPEVVNADRAFGYSQ